jgi:hypothetical protein
MRARTTQKHVLLFSTWVLLPSPTTKPLSTADSSQASVSLHTVYVRLLLFVPTVLCKYIQSTQIQKK